jgi:uncharacterized CHY-type Zn-finger protein
MNQACEYHFFGALGLGEAVGVDGATSSGCPKAYGDFSCVNDSLERRPITRLVQAPEILALIICEVTKESISYLSLERGSARPLGSSSDKSF